MGSTLLKLTTILSLLLISLQFHTRNAFSIDTNEQDEEEEYVLDSPHANSHRIRGRFLTTIKKGTQCNPVDNSICDGISANNGTSLLYCCKKHCRNILGDRNNCGQCGNKCKMFELCCNGECTNVAYNALNCGKCKNQCSPGLACRYGFCGYA